MIYLHYHLLLRGGTVVVVITWQLDLQIPMHSVTITTSVESANPAHCEAKLCQWFASGQWFSPSTPFFSTSKADRHNIAEILLKVALNTITPNPLLRGELAIRHYYSMSYIAIAGIIQYRLCTKIPIFIMCVLVPTVCTLCFFSSFYVAHL